MKTLSCDLETYSSEDLRKCGVYRYAESPDFEILLFAYSVDGGDVQLADLASGEKLPGEIINALTDDTVIKWAWHANFERVCLSRYLRDLGIINGFLNPEGWRCDMVWAATLGLPFSLEGAGAVLGLDKQKLTEGKELVRYFCKPCSPTQANGGRTRNLPIHAPDKWEMFKRYNIRDVEAEMGIQQRLSKFPVPDFVWDEYHLDQEINDRGVRLDMELVRQAIAIDERSRNELISAMREFTQLENPNSVQQMKDWLANNGLMTDSLDKKAVAELMKNAPPELIKVLTLRQQLAKSSVRKYQAMQNAVCADGRARGLFQFYGANRTGRFCLTGDHEVLTDNGWKRLDEWKGGRIACWNPIAEAVSFQDAEQVNFPYEGKMYTYTDVRIDQCSTPDHKMWAKKGYCGAWKIMTVEEMANTSRPAIPLTGFRYRRDCGDPNWLRVLIMTQADGTYTADGSVRYNFKKIRKIERCKTLLRRAEIPFVYKEFKNGVVSITIPARAVPLWLREFRTKTFGYWLLDENAELIFDELPNWDGSRPAPNSIQYSTINKQNADLVQALAHMSGRCCSMKIKSRDKQKYPNWSDAYVLNIWLTPGNHHRIDNKPIVSDFKGTVYCAVTQTGFFLVRRNGKVWVTGNSSKIIQLQNLSRNSMSDLDQARALVRTGDYASLSMLYDDVPDTLSQLVRTAFVPPEGKLFYVADFSAIEARVIAWFAGEKWRSEVFRKGGDIYCASASQMFKVPVEKHGINGHLRQKGKIGELALGFGGGVGALTAMGALEMGLKEEELQPLVNAWRNANPNIVKFWWAVDNAVMEAVSERTTTKTHGLTFSFKSGMLFITLPSGRKLAYVKPRIGINQFGGESITYEGIGATKKWERLESYGPKFVENIVQATARDILCYAMKTLRHCSIVMHIHDEVVIEADPRVSLDALCEQMGRTPPWAEGLILTASGYTSPYYKKD